VTSSLLFFKLIPREIAERIAKADTLHALLHGSVSIR
jgi:hypothetical protein